MKKNIILRFSVFMFVFGIAIIIIQLYNMRQTGINHGIAEAKTISKLVKNTFKIHAKTGNTDDINLFLDVIYDYKKVKEFSIVRNNKFSEKYSGFNKAAFVDKKIHTEIDETLSKTKLSVSLPYILDVRRDQKCLECHIDNKNKNFAAIYLELDISEYKENALKISLIIIFTVIIGILFLILMLSKTLNSYNTIISMLTKNISSASNGIFKQIKNNDNYSFDSNILINKYNHLSISLNDMFIDIDTKLRILIGDSTSQNTDINAFTDAKNVINQLSLIYEFKQQIHLDNSKNEIFTRLSEIYNKQFNIEFLNIYEVDNNQNIKKAFQLGDIDICSKKILGDVNACRVYKNMDDVFSLDYHKSCHCFDDDNYLHYCIDIEMGKNSKILFNFIFMSKEELEKFKLNLSFVKLYIKELSYEVSTKTLVEELENMALKDALTGLYNRKFLDEHLSKLLSLAKREKYNIGFLMLDMDHFKDVNDEYGHDIGDKVLKSFASIVMKNIRDSDIAIRFGGEEFIVLLVNIKKEENMIMIADKIREEVSRAEIEVYTDSTIQKTVSIGASMYPTDSSSFEKIMKLGDIALYEAKESGRNKTVRYVQPSD